MILSYRNEAKIEDLGLNECVIRPCGRDQGPLWLELWFRVVRTTDGQPEIFAVPVAPNESYRENGPGGRTWGLAKAGPGVWCVSPSINVLETGDKVSGAHEARSLWHDTPTLQGLPEPPPWTPL